MAEALRIEVHLLAHAESSEQQLNLKQHIVLIRDLLLNSLLIRTSQDIVAEALDHKELLHH